MRDKHATPKSRKWQHRSAGPWYELLEERSLLTAAPLGGEYQINSTVSADQRDIAIGSHPLATQTIVAWVSVNQDGSGDGVYAQRYDLAGAKVGSAFRANVTTSGNQNAPAVAMDALGNFVIVWQSSSGDGTGNGDGIYMRRYGFDATALAGEARVNSVLPGNQQAPSIAMDDVGNFTVAFQSSSRDSSGNAVVARRFRANGTAIAADFQVNQFTSGNQQAPSVAMSGTGSFVIAWQSAGQDGSGDAIVARKYSNTGSALTAEFVINQATTGNQSAPAITANADGSFIVAWQSAGQDGSGDAVVARRYNTTAGAVGNEFVVNTFTTGNQSAPSTATSAGGFVIAWQSAGQDGNSDAVVARKFFADGSADGAEFVVNTFTAGAQNNPATAIEADGDFLIGWQSPGQEPSGGTSLGVFGRRYSAANDAPVLKQIANQVTDQGGTISYIAQAIDQDLAIDALSYSLVPGAPVGATIDPVSGLFNWSTSAATPGRYFVTVEARDLAGLVDQKQVAMTVFAPGERTALDDYVNAFDASYGWDIRGRTVGDGYIKYDVLLTSGTWRTTADVNKPLWQHWVAVYVPEVITQGRALLFIDGGSSSSTPPSGGEIDPYAGPLAAASGSVFIDLTNVPSQPLQFAGESFSRSEDSIIAYSWRKYLETGDPTWPVNLPMTRAAMRAMDAVSDLLGSPVGGNFDIESFVVTGGSKRGWTTWLASATDPRVSAAIPIVSDLLNMQESFVHHYAYYNGAFSAAVQDYVNQGILDVNKFGTEGVDSLLSIVDPYTYLERLTLPKYILNASGDEFFVPDSWQYYYDDLLGPKAIRYAPNSGHGISDPAYLVDMFGVFLTLSNDGSLPEYSFHQLADGTIELTTAGTVTDAKLWKATNTTKRDFRWPVVGAAFSSTQLTDQGGGVYRGNVPQPANGWTAYFLQLTIVNELDIEITVSSGIYLKGPTTNVRPDLVPIPDMIVPEGTLWTYATSASDADAGQTLSYNLEAGAPPQLSIHPLTGVMSGLWSDQVTGALPVTVTVWDNGTPLLPDRSTFRIQVVNVAPTATLAGPSSGLPGLSQTFTLLATDPSSVDQAAGFTFQLDWDGDGIVDQTVVGPSGTTVAHAFTSGAHTVRLSATDKDGGQSLESMLSVVINSPPVDPLNQQPLAISEGGNLTLEAVGWTDPDNDPLSYAWDVNGDGLFTDTVGAAPSLTWAQLSAIGVNEGPGSFSVRVRVDDGKGGVTISAPLTLTILNAAPKALIAGPTDVVPAQLATFTLSATDPSPVDQAANFAFHIDWNGDGIVDQTVTGPSGMTVNRSFATPGPVKVKLTAVDRNGGASAIAAHDVAVVGAALVPSADGLGLFDLVWGGTSGADHLEIEQVNGTTVRLRSLLTNGAVDNSELDFAGVTGRVIARGAGGNDTINASQLATKATLDGGAGNNTLHGGQGGDLLIGGSNGGEGQQGSNIIIAGNGNNTIYGNDAVGAEGSTGGNNLIVGGAGNDTIYGAYGSVKKKDGTPSNGAEGGQNLIVGGGGSDTIYASQQADGAEGGNGSILVGGSTTLDQAALLGVLSEWTSARTYAQRVANIQDTGTGTRNNGIHFLQAATVQNDDSVDQLYSDTNGELNWLLYSFGQDIAHRNKSGETISDTP